MLWILPLLIFLRSVACLGIGYRLTQSKRILKSSDPYIQCGVVFPISMERCGLIKLDWNQLFIDGVALYHEQYSGAKSENDLKNFLLGVSVHVLMATVEDEIKHGIVHLLADLEFDGDLAQTKSFLHGPADLMHLSHVLRKSDDSWDYYRGVRFLLPTMQDLEHLFELQGQVVDFDEIIVCLSGTQELLQSELSILVAERFSVLNTIYGISPGAPEYILSHRAGGEWNSLSVLSKCVPRMERYFSELYLPTNDSLLNLCQTFKKTSNTNVTNSGISAKNYISPIIPLSLFGSSIVVGNFLNEEISIAVSAPLEEENGSVYIIPLSQIQQQTTHVPTFALYGSSVEKFALFGIDFLVVSEPGNNAIHIHRGYDRILTILDSSTTFQEVNYVMDIDGDSIPDLILSSSRFSDSEVGRVIIIPGLNILNFLMNGKKNQVESIESIGYIALYGPESILRQHYGVAMTSSIGFFFVTCQNLGVIYVYRIEELTSVLLPAFYIMDENIILSDEDLPWKLKRVKSNKHGLFGYTIYHWEYKGSVYIASSQPIFNRIFIYKDSGRSIVEFFIILELEPMSDSHTVYESIRLGVAMTFDAQKEVLYVSSPGSFDGTGAIWTIQMSEIIKTRDVWKEKKLFLSPLKHLHMVNSDLTVKGWSNFGSDLVLSPSGLIVAIPQYGYGNVENLPLIGSLFTS